MFYLLYKHSDFLSESIIPFYIFPTLEGIPKMWNVKSTILVYSLHSLIVGHTGETGICLDFLYTVNIHGCTVKTCCGMQAICRLAFFALFPQKKMFWFMFLLRFRMWCISPFLRGNQTHLVRVLMSIHILLSL